MRGSKPKLAGNVSSFPQNDAPSTADIDKAAAFLLSIESFKPLSKSERGVWNWYAPELVRLGRLKRHFASALAELCILEVRMREQREFLNAEEWEYVVSGRNGVQRKSRPQVAQLNDDFRKLLSLYARFGLTPTDERSLSAGNADIFDDFDKF